MMPVFSTRKTNLRRTAFTLVELLVVITIIGILIGLLMPAVNAARESGRRATCMNNVKQLAAACVAHESAQGFLPTGGWAWGWGGDPDRGYTKRQPGGWHYNILPYMEQADLHDIGKGLDDATKKAQSTLTAQTAVAAFICPTRRKVQSYPHSLSAPYWINVNEPTTAGRSDYAANGGDFAKVDTFWRGPGSLAAGDALTEADWKSHFGTWGNGATGVVFRRSECTIASIKDGATFTYLLGEKYVSPDHYFTANQIGPNYYCSDNQGWDEGFDYDTNRWTGTDGPGIGLALPPRQDTPGLEDNGTCARIFGSAHASGLHMAFCDGSVRKMNYNIDPVIHQQLGNRMDGQPTQIQKIY